MARRAKKAKKAKAREQAKRREAALRRRSTGGGLAARMERAARWPLLECRVNEGWQDERFLAQVLVARRSGASIALAFFLVDLQCLGVKNCIARPELDRREYAEHLRRFVEASPLAPCSPGLAAAIVRAGVDYAAGLGFRPHPDFRLARPLLEGLGPAADDEVVVCGGRDGKPLYVAGPHDDARRVLRHLDRRLGGDGYHFVAPLDDGGGPRSPTSSWAERPLAHRAPRAIADLDLELGDGDPDDLASALLRFGAIKRALVGFAGSVDLVGERRRFAGQRPRSDGSLMDGVDLLEDFIHGHCLSDGRRVIEAFAELLTGPDRAAVLAWQDGVVSVFRIEASQGPRVDLHSLVDDLGYRAFACAPGALDDQPAGAFLLTRLVPFERGWLFSGQQRVYEAHERATAWEIAAEMAKARPALALRNPELLRRSWELQRRQGEDFEACFCGREILVPGPRLAAHLARLDRRGQQRAAAEHGLGALPPPRTAEQIERTFPDSLRRARCVGVLHDDRWGLGLYIDYDMLDECMHEPGLAARPEYAEVVLGYLESESVDPLPLLVTCDRQPDGASEVFGRLLGRPGFRWEADGEALLRHHKAEAYARQEPRVVAFHDELSEAVASLGSGRRGAGS